MITDAGLPRSGEKSGKLNLPGPHFQSGNIFSRGNLEKMKHFFQNAAS